jgi:lipoprotein-anchoring transpeptidase ErfK/SrfK
MRCLAAAIAAAVSLAVCVADRPARAEVLIAINKSKQRMTVVVDGSEKFVWKVSTGLRGAPRTGVYHPERLERKWFSHKYGMSPMPHSIFFHDGIAIHGTIYVSRLGRRASHGCVRLRPDHAAILFDLVRGRAMAGTTIVVSNEDYVAPKPAPARIDAAATPINPSKLLPDAAKPAGR